MLIARSYSIQLDPYCKQCFLLQVANNAQCYTLLFSSLVCIGYSKLKSKILLNIFKPYFLWSTPWAVFLDLAILGININ